MEEPTVSGAPGVGERGSGFPTPERAPGPLGRFLLALSLSPRAFQLRYRPLDWAIPLLVVLALHFASGLILQDLYVNLQVEAMQRQFESNPQMSAEQREAALERMTGNPLFRWSAPISSVVIPPVGALVAAAGLLLILNFGMGGSARFGPLWFLTTLALAPKAVWAIVFTAVALAKSSADISFGPAVLLAGEENPIKGFLRVFDLFELWVFAAQLVGISVVTGLATKKARTAVVILWVIYWVLALLFSVAAGCIAKMGAAGPA